MTNDKKININPLFNSEIQKLEPIKKEREKEKVEYIENFRNNKKKNNDINNNIIIDPDEKKYIYNKDNLYQIIIFIIILFQ